MKYLTGNACKCTRNTTERALLKGSLKQFYRKPTQLFFFKIMKTCLQLKLKLILFSFVTLYVFRRGWSILKSAQ